MPCVQRKQYEELGNDRNLACVRVMSPEAPLREVWRLYWTIKRPRDPNVRMSPSGRTPFQMAK